jgi:hypothetical protein
MEDVELIKLYVKEHSVSNFAVSAGEYSCLVFEVKDEWNLSPLCIAHFHYRPDVLKVNVFLDRKSIEQLCTEEEVNYYHGLKHFPGDFPILSEEWDWNFVDLGNILAFLNTAKPPALR